MQRGLDGAAATGAELLRAFFLTMLAHATGTAGQPEPGLRLLAEALQVMERTGECFYEAELYRLYGELSLRMGERETGRTEEEEKIAHSPIHPLAYSSPEACFQKAIDLACQQQAKSLELRATMSLARLWQRQGKPHQARTMLSEIYGWFAGGFDTADLNEAKMLLEKLTG
jgi:predicted ATPase